MIITKQEVEQFQQIWREEFGEEISEEEVRYHIRRLDTLYFLLSQRPPEADRKP